MCYGNNFLEQVLKALLELIATHQHASYFIQFQTNGNLFKQVLYYVLPSMGDRQGSALNTVKDIQQSSYKILNMSCNFHVNFEPMLFEFKM